MSLLIATPCYGGMCHSAFLESCLSLEATLTQVGLDHSWLFTKNESLITRGRNTSATKFLQTHYERLLFIDSDIEFAAEDVAKLWNIDSPGADVAVGVYRMKREGSPYAAWVNGSLIEDLPDHPIEVDYAGTGFMMIKRSVFTRLMQAHPEWKYEESIGECWAFFQDPIEDGIHLSEDYFFSKRVRDLGMKVVMDPAVKLKHWGQKCFD